MITARVGSGPMQQLRPGLWTWTAAHPAWTEADGGPDGWERNVRSYAYDAGGCLVLFDPIAPPSLLDGLIEGQEVSVLLTCEWHRRSTDECVERFGAHVYAPTDELPGGVELQPTYYDAEVAYWIPQHAALVVGDVFTAQGALKVQDTWLSPDTTAEQMRAGVRPLADLPVEVLLVTHGEPVEDAAAQLRAALAA
jgi:hypothetical protein